MIVMALACLDYFISDVFQAENRVCEYYEQHLKESYKGQVLKVFIDKEDHASQKVIIEDFKGNRIDIYFNLDKSGIFQYLKEDDNIKKQSNNPLMIVERGGGLSHFYLDYGCDEITNPAGADLQSVPSQ